MELTVGEIMERVYVIESMLDRIESEKALTPEEVSKVQTEYKQLLTGFKVFV